MRISCRDIIAICLLILGSLGLSAQHYNYPLDKYSRYFLLRTDTAHYGAFQGQTVQHYDVDTIKGFEPKKRYSGVTRKLYDSHLFEIDAPDFKANIDLLLNFEVGKELWEDNVYQDSVRMSRNMRGFRLQAEIGEKVSISTSFREFQSAVPHYLYEYSRDTGVMPGSGRIKTIRGVRDHNSAEGYVSYAPNDKVNFQFGHQRNFIGSGYRSLLLSDHAYAYPQLKMSLDLWKNRIHYHVIHAWLQTLQRLPLGDTPESLFSRKNGSFKYLEFQPIDRLTVGFFEGVMWNRFDPVEGTLAPNPKMFSPIIGTSAITLGLDDPLDNVLVGVDFGYRPFDGLLVYGQYVSDEESREGYQIGFRTIDLGLDGLSFRAEYNSVNPFTYFGNLRRQGYHHFREPLAHSMGTGFDEVSLGLMYFYERAFVDVSYVSAEQLGDFVDADGETCTPGGDIFSPATCTVDEHPEDLSIHLEQIDARVGYMFNAKSNFSAYISWLYRDKAGIGVREQQSMIAFGIEMTLFNRYEDF